ncbi:MAG: hypothetical protein M0Z36_05345 [Thermaerobacter sp.]|nr:hypothetical protein [Thermaerobacter sp.]
MIAVSVSPPAIAIARPSQPWHRTITVRVRGLGGQGIVQIQPAIGSGNHLLPTHLPAWLHVPSTLHLRHGMARVLIRGQAPAHTALDLALQVSPVIRRGRGVSVIGAPAVSVLVGQPGVQRASLHVQAPIFRLTRGSQPITITERNTGTAWIAPSVRIAGRQLTSSMPLMPGQSTSWHIPIPMDRLGSDPIQATAPIARPATATTMVIPAGPIASVMLGGAALYAAYALGERRQRKQKKE